MIDIHCHILPGVDDGSQSMDESLEMARYAVKEGIHTIIATPHHGNGTWENEANLVFEKVERLNAELDKNNIPLKVLPGQEVRVRKQVLEECRSGRTIPLNMSRYILIEFSFTELPERIDELFDQLRSRNLIPIIAHPERYPYIVENPQILTRLVSQGSLSQVTAQSLTGSFGPQLQAISLELCRRNLVHLIASDAHNVKTRPFELKEAYETVEEKLGAVYKSYFLRNARHVLDNTLMTIG